MAPIVLTCLRSRPPRPSQDPPPPSRQPAALPSHLHLSITPSIFASCWYQLPASVTRWWSFCSSLKHTPSHTHHTHTPPHTPTLLNPLVCERTIAPRLTIIGHWSHWRVNESPVLAADLGSVWHQENLECVKRWTCASLLTGGRYVVRCKRRTEAKEEMPQLQTNVESGRQTPADLKNNFFF